MSHVVTIQTELTDLEAVKAACKELGLTFVENQNTYKWWGRSEGDFPLPQGFKEEDLGKCEHAIKVPNTPWEIGVTHARNADGSPKKGYTLLCDFYGHRGAPIARALGGVFSDKEQTYCTELTFHKFTQMYGVHKATIEARRKGYMVARKAGKNGSIQLVVTGMK